MEVKDHRSWRSARNEDRDEHTHSLVLAFASSSFGLSLGGVTFGRAV